MRALIICLFVSASLSAQSLHESADKHSVGVMPVIAYVGCAAVDIGSTYRFLQYDRSYVRERFYPGRWLENRPKTLVVASAASTALLAYVGHRWVGRKHPVLARTLFYGAAAAHCGFGLDNLTIMDPVEMMHFYDAGK